MSPPAEPNRADQHGLITVESKYSVEETLDRAEALLRAAGTRVFARIDHHAAAAALDLAMPPMQLLIFGNPRAGTPLMTETPTFGIDLPLKLLAWQSADGRVWLAFNSLVWLAARHDTTTVEKLKVLDTGVLTLAQRAAQSVSAIETTAHH
jgi:uncharacterized protein (DUF302 family)